MILNRKLNTKRTLKMRSRYRNIKQYLNSFELALDPANGTSKSSRMQALL